VKLKNKVAIVTGTSPHIGGGIAEQLAIEGAALVCVDFDAKNAEDCANAIVKSGGKAIAVTCNVLDEAQVVKAVNAAEAAFGQVDILVNNAAIFNKKGVLDMSLAEWSQQTGIILTGAFLFTKYVAQSMLKKNVKGSVINIISTAGHQGEPGNVAYSTSKAGLMNFTRSVAMELSAKGIRVNSLTPTATDPTEGWDRARRWGRDVKQSGIPPALMEFVKRVPGGKLPVPSDYGKAAVFLCSDDARMVNGFDLRVDTGAVAKYWGWDPRMDN